MEETYYSLFFENGCTFTAGLMDLNEAINEALCRLINEPKFQVIEIRPKKRGNAKFSTANKTSYYLNRNKGLLDLCGEKVLAPRADINIETWAKINELIIKNNINNQKKKQRYNVFQRINGLTPFGLYIQSTFKEVINYCSDKVFHGNDQIEFEIRPVNCRVEDNKYLPDHRQSAYLVKENNNPKLKCFKFASLGLGTPGWYEMTAQEIDEWDNKEEEINCPIAQAVANFLPDIEEIRKNNPIEFVVLLNKKEIMDLLLMLNFIAPTHEGVEKYFNKNIINKLKETCGDYLVNE